MVNRMMTPDEAVQSMLSDIRRQSNQGGRPSDYTDELGSEICRRLAEGESVNRICKDEAMPCRATVITWALGQVEAAKAGGFPDKYALARMVQQELLADEIHDIADDSARDVIDDDGKKTVDHEHIQRSKLRVDTRKWYLSAIVPRFKPKSELGFDPNTPLKANMIVEFVNPDAGTDTR